MVTNDRELKNAVLPQVLRISPVEIHATISFSNVYFLCTIIVASGKTIVR